MAVHILYQVVFLRKKTTCTSGCLGTCSVKTIIYASVRDPCSILPDYGWQYMHYMYAVLIIYYQLLLIVAHLIYMLTNTPESCWGNSLCHLSDLSHERRYTSSHTVCLRWLWWTYCTPLTIKISYLGRERERDVSLKQPLWWTKTDRSGSFKHNLKVHTLTTAMIRPDTIIIATPVFNVWSFPTLQ